MSKHYRTYATTLFTPARHTRRERRTQSNAARAILHTAARRAKDEARTRAKALTDEREAVCVVRAEDALDGVHERGNVVADAASAQVAEVPEVPAQLRGIHARHRAQLGGRDRRHPVLPKLDERVQVRREALDDASGHWPLVGSHAGSTRLGSTFPVPRL